MVNQGPVNFGRYRVSRGGGRSAAFSQTGAVPNVRGGPTTYRPGVLVSQSQTQQLQEKPTFHPNSRYLNGAVTQQQQQQQQQQRQQQHYSQSIPQPQPQPQPQHQPPLQNKNKNPFQRQTSQCTYTPTTGQSTYTPTTKQPTYTPTTKPTQTQILHKQQKLLPTPKPYNLQHPRHHSPQRESVEPLQSSKDQFLARRFSGGSPLDIKSLPELGISSEHIFVAATHTLRYWDEKNVYSMSEFMKSVYYLLSKTDSSLLIFLHALMYMDELHSRFPNAGAASDAQR
eukprot:Pgem_evm1s4377